MQKKYVLSRAQMHQRNKNILWALFNIPIHFNSQPNNRMDGLALHKHIVKYQELYSVKHDKPAEWKRTMQLENYLGFHPWKLKTDKIHWKDSIVLSIWLHCNVFVSAQGSTPWPMKYWRKKQKCSSKMFNHQATTLATLS